MPAIRDFSQGYHTTTTLKHVEAPIPVYAAGDLLLAVVSIDDSAGGGAQNVLGGMPAQYARYDDGGVFTNYDIAANNATAADFFVVAVAPAVNDAFYVGSATTFKEVDFLFSTQGVGTWTNTWEYWNGAAWVTVNTPSDGTTSFKAATTVHARVTHVPQTNWATTTVNGVSAYWLRSRVSAFTSITTRPVCTQLWVIPVETSGSSGWKQLFAYSAGTTPSPTTVVWKIASASEPVATTFFYNKTAETANVELISIRDVAQVHDTGSAALTINVNATNRTFIRTTGSFATDGFEVNDTIDMTGFTNAGNNTNKIIESITTTTNANDTITVTSGTGLVTETGTNDERIVSTPFNNTKFANANASTSKQNLPTLTTNRNNCLLVWTVVSDAVSVPSIIEGACQLIAGKDGAAHSDGCAWGFQAVAGVTPTVTMSQMSAVVTTQSVIAINPPATGATIIPGYCSADASVYVSPFTGAAYNGDSVPTATITTPFTGTINGRPLANGGTTVTRTDSGINSYHAMNNVTGVTTNGSFAGTRTTIVARTTLASKNILFHIQPYLPVNIQTTDSVALIGACGVAIGLASTTGNFKVWHVAGSGTSWGVQRHQPVVINTDATAGLLQTTGTLNTASITEIGLMVSSKIVAASWLVGSVWALDTCTIAGGNAANPLSMDQIVASYADGHERRSAIRQGANQALFLGPVQIGDGGTNPVYLSLDATAAEFPRQYNKTLKEVYYNSVDNYAGLIYYPGASDTIIHKNSIISSPSRYKWGLHASASTSATYDFSGLAVIGAGTITLNKAITVTGLTINDYSTIDASSLTLLSSTIKAVPATNDSVTTNSTSTFTSCIIDVSAVTSGNRWLSTATPDKFSLCTFTGGGGHALRLTATGSFTLDGNTWTSFGADGTNGAAIYNDSGGAVTLTITNGSAPTIRNGVGASTTLIVSPVTTQVTTTDATSGSVISGARVLVLAADATGPLPYQKATTITRSGSTATATCTAHGLTTGSKALIKGANQAEYNGLHIITNTGANTFTFKVSGTPTTPATGTILTTGVLIAGKTDGVGVISDIRSLASSQNVTGRARYGTDTASPGGLGFNAAADALTTVDGTIVADLNYFSTSFWLKRPTGVTDSIPFEAEANGSNFIVYLNGGTLTLTDGYGFATLATGPVLTVETWYYVGVVRNGTALALYVGTEGAAPTKYTGTDALLGTTQRILHYGTSGNLYLGAAIVSHARVWDAILSDAEIEAERTNFDPVRTADLKAEWPLNDTANPYVDISGNENTLVNAGSGTWTSHTGPSFPAKTKYRTAGISGTVSSTTGLSTTLQLIPDQ